jgi:RsiW-degrading membrane proteinase PrsW (M82 family)/uncharacterized membrane protein YhaH (DUF805 family)
MNFFQATGQALRRYFDFTGRSCRSEYWYFNLFIVLLWIPAFAVDMRLGWVVNQANEFGPVFKLTNIVTFIPASAVWVRRLHDCDCSGWWILCPPVALFFACVRGTQGDNRFGPNPLARGTSAKPIAPQSAAERIEAITRLAELRAKGFLTDEEFSAEKARLMQEGVAQATASPQENQASDPQATEGGGVANFITSRLGLERIEQFSLSHLFSETFKKHEPEAIEDLFCVGGSLSTPPLTEAMKKFPTPWVFFRALLTSAFLFGVFLAMFYLTSNLKMIPGIMILGSFAVPLATLILFFEMNSPRNVSMYRVLSFVFAGGTASLFLTLFVVDPLANSLLGDYYSIFGAGVAGIVEESAKVATVIFLLSLFPPNRYPYRLNALLFGAAVGAGFAAFESAGYALEYGLLLNGGVGAMVGTILIRALFTPLCHIAWTAITCAAYWNARQQHASALEAVASPIFVKLFTVPVVLHFAWNTVGIVWIQITLGLVAWVILISLIQSGLKDIQVELQAPNTQSGQEMA